MDIARRAIQIVKTEGPCAFAGKACRYIRARSNFLLLPYAILKVKSFDTGRSGPEALLNLAFDGFAGLIRPAQVPSEMLRLVGILGRRNPKAVLEIGTAKGGTLFLLCHVSSTKATIISVDLPGGKFGGGYPMWRIPLYKSFALRGQRLQLVRGNSHQPETLEEAKSLLGKHGLDFVFIDGDHSYDGVRQDFEMYYRLVTDGGMIAFHDIVPGRPEDVGGVPQFWEEIKGRYKTTEIVKDWGQGGYGIGLIYKEPSQRNSSSTRRGEEAGNPGS